MTTMEDLDSDPEVQDIDPPLLARSGRKKYCRRILIYPIDSWFYCRSKRNKNHDQETADSLDVIILAQTSINIDSISVANSTSATR
jgi:hypothetical protein